MKLRYLNHEYEFEDTDHLDTILIDGIPAHQHTPYGGCYHEMKWEYAREDGMFFLIPRERFYHLFQDELREAIQSTGKTMREVAEALDVPYRTMQDWRAGRREPSKFVQQSVIEQIKSL